MIAHYWYHDPVQTLDQEALSAARAHQSILTKPAGSLGLLETLAEQYAAWQGKTYPSIEHIAVVIFAGDHGVCAQGVSAFPQAVTTQMIMNFLSGGAAISVLSRALPAVFSVVNMGTVTELPTDVAQHTQLTTVNIAPGTADFSQTAAMSDEQLQMALAAGRAQVQQLSATDIFIGAEMGIGNTTSASAIYAALLSLRAQDVVGPGTGIDQAGIIRKQTVVDAALARHKLRDNSLSHHPYEVLRCVGGFEIAALVASYIAAAQRGIPILVDGFICTAAALLAVAINPGVRAWLLFSHCSAEPAHKIALDYLQARPLLDLGLRLGEGSGAALAVPLIQSALLLHRQMATFSQAGVSDQHA